MQKVADECYKLWNIECNEGKIYLSYILLNTYGCDLLFIAEPCLLMLKRPYLLAEKVGELEHVDDQNGQTIYQRHCMCYMSITKMSQDHLPYWADILIAH